MKFEINQWLQEAIYQHAQSMACEKVRAEHGGEEGGWHASDRRYGWGGDSPNPHYGAFEFEVSKGVGKDRVSYRVELELRDVVRDYVKE